MATYSSLSTSVFRRLNRPAETDVFDDCLEFAEAEINRRLALSPVRPMHTSEVLSIDAETKAVPTDYLDTDNLYIGSDPIHSTVLQNLQSMYEQDDTEGQPRYYAQEGSALRFYPSPDATYNATHLYWAKVPALTSGAPTNWLSLAHPDVYLHGVEAYAKQEYAYPQDDIDASTALFDAAIQKVLDAYPRQQDRSPLRVEVALRPIRFNITTG